MTHMRADGIRYLYDKHIVLDGVSFDIREGEILGILGPNGCGKTTLLRNLNKNLTPYGGCVFLDGENLQDISKRDVAKSVAVVPQTNEIRFSFTVREIVSMGRAPYQSMMGGETREDREIVDKALEQTGLADFAERHINTMSGGERQRAMIARAIAQSPKILLMDEPTLHLDINMQFDALNLVHRLSRENGLTVVIVSHDLGMVARYCDRIIMIHDHRIHSMGTPEEVLSPENMKTVFNVDAELVFDAKIGKNTVLLHDSYNNIGRPRGSRFIYNR